MGAVTLRPSAATPTASKPSSAPPKVSCGKCRRVGHSSGECPFEGTLAQVNAARDAAKEDEKELKHTSVAFASVAERDKRYKEVEERFGRCKNCGSHHTYERTIGTDKVQWPSCRLSSCPQFDALSPVEKGKMVESLTACPKCLAWTHIKRFCPKKGYPCKIDDGNGPCKKYHDPVLHQSKNRYCEAAAVR